MANHRGLLFALYTSQYLGIGFIYFGLSGILRSRGVDLQSLAVIQLLGAVWVAKVVWAPCVDRFRIGTWGRYRGWLLLTQAAMVLSVASLLCFNPPDRHLPAVLGAVVLFVLASATQDVAADAIVAHYQGVQDQAGSNAIASTASYVGNVLGGGLVLFVYDRFGWHVAIALLAVLALLPLPLVVRFREPAQTSEPVSLRQRFAQIARTFGQSRMRSWMLLALPLYWGGAVAGYGLIVPMVADAGWSLTRIAALMGLWIAIPAAVGAWAFVAVQARCGVAPTMTIGGVAAAIGALGLMAVALRPDSLPVVLGGTFVYLVPMVFVTTAVTFATMRHVRKRYVATDFATMMAVGFVWTYLAGFLALYLAAFVGYQVSAACAGVAALAGVLCMRRHWSRHPETAAEAAAAMPPPTPHTLVHATGPACQTITTGTPS